ncbi:MAG: hypothetical protein LBL75_00315, partial [Rickettsiales bacterium]|nr:hypothetical protein [Rickettsiales bacterium]
MAAIKTTISDVKKSVPNNILWIVLGSAFVVVAILLGVLLSGGDDTNKPSEPAAPAEELKLMTDPAEIDWLDTPLGDAQTASITISANTMAKIPNIKLSRDIDGMGIRSACLISAIEPGIPCIATLSWTAAQEIQKTSVKIMVDYYPIGAGEKMTKTLEIPVAVSTKKVAPAPAPVATPEPAPAPKLENPVAAAITEIAPPIQIAAAPKPAPAPTTSALTTEKCYEFAFGGYDAYGKQIGWIRPQNGRFLFHPFSDTDCTSPNGEYNAETGFITDLKNPSRKIGSDFDHIGFIMAGSAVPTLSNPAPAKTKIRARQSEVASNAEGASKIINFGNASQSDLIPSSYNGGDAFVSSKNPYDRKFVLRQYKPIPATIVNEIRADSKISPETMLPVQATVDRNVYSDNGRTIIIPAGTLMLGYLTGDLPGPYKAIGRMQMKWYRFVRPDGVEFNFGSDEPFAADSQGRVGVPGYGSTDYIEQFFMPMVTAIVPAAVNLIAPISDKFVNQIDLDNNTVTQSGQVRSSELAKNEII